jgi:hypothetical protein
MKGGRRLTPYVLQQLYAGKRAGQKQSHQDGPEPNNRFLTLYPEHITPEKSFSGRLTGESCDLISLP